MFILSVLRKFDWITATLDLIMRYVLSLVVFTAASGLKLRIRRAAEYSERGDAV